MKYRKITEEELKFIKNNKNNMTDVKLGKALERNKNSIHGIKMYYGIKRSKRVIKKFESENGRANRKKPEFKKIPCKLYPEIGDCIICTSHSKSNGYPVIVRNKKRYYMKNYLWEKKHDKIPKGICVLHKCDNSACVNLKHLYLGTRKDNMVDMARRGRGNRKLTNGQVIKVLESNKSRGILINRYNVSPSVISNIKRGKTYQDVFKRCYNL